MDQLRGTRRGQFNSDLKGAIYLKRFGVFYRSLAANLEHAKLYGDLAEELYMELPPGVDMEAGSGLVCKLKKMALWTGAATDSLV